MGYNAYQLLPARHYAVAIENLVLRVIDPVCPAGGRVAGRYCVRGGAAVRGSAVTVPIAVSPGARA